MTSGSQKQERLSVKVKVGTGLTALLPTLQTAGETGRPQPVPWEPAAFCPRATSKVVVLVFIFLWVWPLGLCIPRRNPRAVYASGSTGGAFPPPDRLGCCVYEAGCKSFRASDLDPPGADTCHRPHEPRVSRPPGTLL